mgnify:FL=1
MKIEGLQICEKYAPNEVISLTFLLTPPPIQVSFPFKEIDSYEINHPSLDGIDLSFSNL